MPRFLLFWCILLDLFPLPATAQEALRHTADSLTQLGEAYHREGRFEQALPLFRQALGLREKALGKEHPDYAASLKNLGVLFQQTGQNDQALLLYRQALRIREKTLGRTHPDYAASLNNLADIYRKMGHYEKALPLYQEALAVSKKVWGREHPEYANSLKNLAYLYAGLGQYEKALLLYRQVLDIREKTTGRKHPQYAAALNNLAELYRKMGRLEKALPLSRLSLDIREEVLGKDHPKYAAALNDLGIIYMEMEQYEKALPLLQQALSTREKVLGKEHPDYATSLKNLALLYRDMGKYAEAHPLLQQALHIREKTLGKDHPFYANILKALAVLQALQHQPEEALDFAIRAVQTDLAHIAATYTTLSEEEKMRFMGTLSSKFNTLPSLLFTTGSPLPGALQQLYNSQLQLKGMVLQDQQQVVHTIRQSRDSTALALYEQWIFHKELLGGQLLLPLAKRNPHLDSLQEVANRLEQELSRRSALFRSRRQQQRLALTDIAGKLAPTEAAVEFISFPVYRRKATDSIVYAALLLVAGDTAARFIPLFEEKQLWRLLKPSLSAKTALAQYAAIQKLYARPEGRLPHPLYQLVWKPLEPHLAGIRTVYFAPAGLLHRVAFQALRPDAGRVLADDFQLNQVLSTRSVALPAAIARPPASANLWGHIVYHTRLPAAETGTARHRAHAPDTTASAFNFYTTGTRSVRGGEWSMLPGAKAEMDSIGKLFRAAGVPVTLDSGAAATEDAFKALSGNSPQVLHLATHGFFLAAEGNGARDGDPDAGGSAFTVQQNPMFRSGLVLAGANHAWQGKPVPAGTEDGILTAYEIARLDLGRTDVVVLSACETARGDLQDQEGVMGLQRAFKLAGVKQLVMSLWRVPDEETAELMTLFYRYWLEGRSTREAFRAAQLQLKEKYAPFYWAAFILVE